MLSILKKEKTTVQTKSVVAKNPEFPYTLEIKTSYDDLISKEHELEDIQSLFRDEMSEGNLYFNLCLKKNKIEIYNISIEVQNKLELSCGVALISGISSLHIFHTQLNNLEGKKLLKKTLKKLFDKIKLEGKFSFIVASNNNQTEWSNKILDSLALTKTDYKPNPNMQNNSRICVWTF